MKKILFKIFVILFALILFLLFFCYQGVYTEKDPQGEDVVFVVEKGDGVFDIAGNLEERGIIKKEQFFVLYTVFSGKEKDLKAGSYLLSSSMNVAEIVGEMFLGSENKVTIIEGWNLRDIAGYLKQEGFGDAEEFYSLAGEPPFFEDGKLRNKKEGKMEWEIAFLEKIPDIETAEGFLFPDTYYISPGTPVENVLEAMLLNFERKVVRGMKKEITGSEMSLFEIITLASLLEREVRDFEEKRIIAGIIKERLEKGMRLQIDATITYLTGRRSVNIPIEETRINSPYNTYVYTGFPKGPICSPSIESIEAALSPKESEYLYYLSKRNGETVFSRTHNEHVEAKKKYLR